MTRAEADEWLDAYDSLGIRPDAKPPGTLLDLAKESTHIISSDLPRAIESAKRLTQGRDVTITPLLRESKLPVPRWPTRMPFVAWGLAIHAAWISNVALGADVTEPERRRAAESAEWLTGTVGNGRAIVVTHGVFRRMLANELVQLGWTSTGRRGWYRHWSSWIFDRN